MGTNGVRKDLAKFPFPSYLFITFPIIFPICICHDENAIYIQIFVFFGHRKSRKEKNLEKWIFQ
jgi:hypothetical protein